MKIITYKCDCCGITFPECDKSKYVAHLKEHAKVKLFLHNSKQFCGNNKEAISTMFCSNDIEDIKQNFYDNSNVILDYIMRKYYITNISSFQKYENFMKRYKQMLSFHIDNNTMSKNDDETHYIISAESSSYVDVPVMTHECNFGSGVMIKVIDCGINGIKLILLLKKEKHNLG